MKQLAAFVSRYMEEHRIGLRGLARKAGIEASQLSRLLNGERGLDRTTLTLLAGAMTRRERAELLAAHLRDECYGPGADMVRVVVAGGTRTPLARIERGTLGYLRRAMDSDAALRKMLINLAQMHRQQRRKA